MSQIALQGRLDSFHLSEIFQSFVMGRRSGILRVFNETGQKLLYLSEGQIQRVSSGDRPSMKLGEILIHINKITEAQLKAAINHHAQHGLPIGESLVALDLVTEDELQGVLVTQIQEEISDLFTWDGASFEFIEDIDPEELFRQFGFTHQKSRVRLNTQSIVLEAARRIDEWERIKDRAPDLAMIYLLQSKPEEQTEETSLAGFKLDFFDGRRSLTDVLQETFLSRFSVVRRVLALVDAGVLRALTEDECYEIGLSQLQNNDPTNASAYFEASRKQAADLLASCARITRTYMQNGFKTEASRGYVLMAQERLACGDIQGGLGDLETGFEADPQNMALSENLFILQCELENKEKALEIGNNLLDFYSKDTSLHQIKISELSTHTLELDPDNLAHHIMLSRIMEKNEEQEDILELLLELEKRVLGKKEPEALEGLYCRILEIAPSRRDIQRKLKICTRAKRINRMRLVVVTTIAVAATGLVIFLLRYYLYGRIAFHTAQEKEMALLEFRRSASVLSAYQKVVDECPMTVSKKDAMVAITRIQALSNRWEKDDRKKAAALNAAALFEKGTQARKSQDLKNAFHAWRNLLDNYAASEPVAKVLLPLKIDSRPPGVEVWTGETLHGRTPLVIDYKPGSLKEIVLKKKTFTETVIAVKEKEFQDITVSLDKQIIWTAELGGPVDVTATLTEKNVFILCRNGRFYVLDRDHGTIKAEETVGEPGDIFSSPIIYGRIAFWGHCSGNVIAYDTENKKVLWRMETGGMLRSLAGPDPKTGILFAASYDGLLYALDVDTGASRWVFPTKNRLEGITAPKYGKVYLGSRDNWVYGLDAASGRRLWQYETANDCTIPPVADVHQVFAVNKGGHCYALDADKGNLIWKIRLPSEIIGSPAISSSMVFLVTALGKVVSLDLRTGKILWEFKMDSGGSSSAVTTGSSVYVADEKGVLYAIEAATGKASWRKDLNSRIQCAPMISNNQIIIAAANGKVWRIDLASVNTDKPGKQPSSDSKKPQEDSSDAL